MEVGGAIGPTFVSSFQHRGRRNLSFSPPLLREILECTYILCNFLFSYPNISIIPSFSLLPFQSLGLSTRRLHRGRIHIHHCHHYYRYHHFWHDLQSSPSPPHHPASFQRFACSDTCNHADSLPTAHYSDCFLESNFFGSKIQIL